MIKCIVDEIIDIITLDGILTSLENELKRKMYKCIDIKKEDIIKLGKCIRNKNKKLYKDSKIRKKMGNMLKLMKFLLFYGIIQTVNILL